MLTCEALKKNVRKFVPPTSPTLVEFEYVLSAFEQIYQQVFPDTKAKVGQTLEQKPGGGRKAALTNIGQKLPFVLVYQKSCLVQSFMGELFGVDQSQTNEWIHQLLPILKQALDDLGHEPERDPTKFKNKQGQKGAVGFIIDGAQGGIRDPKK